jgi:hypothetical protein
MYNNRNGKKRTTEEDVNAIINLAVLFPLRHKYTKNAGRTTTGMYLKETARLRRRALETILFLSKYKKDNNKIATINVSYIPVVPSQRTNGFRKYTVAAIAAFFLFEVSNLPISKRQ